MKLIDTDVLIWYLRGNQNAKNLIDAQRTFSISVITYMELVQGMRNKNELRVFRKALRDWQASIIYIDEEISAKAMFYVEQHFLSHAVHLADAMIGATAVVTGLPLVTANEKHYSPIKDIEIEKFQP